MDIKRNPIVSKSNLLIEAAYRLTLAEQRLLLAVLGTSVDSHPAKPACTKDAVITLEVSAISDLFSVPYNQAYELMVEAVDRLAERWVIIDAPDPDEPDLVRTKTRWVSAIDYLPGKGQVRLLLAARILPYLTQLRAQFTSYRLQHVAKMKSVYAIRLYELLCQWQLAGQREVSVDWFKEQFQLDGLYDRITDLKRRVIDPAVKQINEHSNLWVSYGQKKSGRVVVALQFTFGVKQEPGQQPPALDAPKKPPRRRAEPMQEQATLPGMEQPKRRRMPTEHQLSRFARPGESRDAALQRYFQQKANIG